MSTPARNASVHKTGRIGPFASFFSRSSVRSTILAACGAMLIAGCNQVGTGLSSNLPPAGGGGLLSFVSVSMPDAIAGRTYSKVAVTSVETQSKTNFPISPAIASGTAPLASCTVTAGSLPPGMNTALTIDPTGSGCLISGTPSASDAGNTYQFTIQALDSNSPPRAAAQTFSVKIRPEFTVTAPSAIVGGALPSGVQGRSYGQIAGNAAAFTATTTLSATNGNGPVGAKNYCTLTVTPALASLTMTQVSGTNNCMLQGSGVLAAAGSYKVSIALTDNPIVDPETNLAAVPANTVAGASNASLNVGSPLKIVAQSDGVSATPPAAVQGRAYGTGSGCSGGGGACLPLTYVATGGLPSVEPADAYLFTDSGLAGAGLTCAATAPSTVAKTTCSGTAGAPGTSTFSVTVDDAGNLATQGGSASGTTSTISGLSLTVDSTLSLAVSPDPAANPAVQNTAYGIGTGCTGAGGNCVAPTYTPTGGLGSYSFSVTGTPPAGITCAANGGNTAVVCSGTASATAATSTFGVSASDVANASSPSASASPISKTLTVNGALTLTPPASVPTAVTGRAFGMGAGCSGGNCVPAVFTVSGGQGTYAATAEIVSAPGTWTCPLSGSQYNCSSASVGAGTTLSIAASDGASATTPGQTTASASVPITVNAAMALTPPAQASIQDAVTARRYGQGASCSGGNCLPVQYGVGGGLGTYTAGTLAIGTGAPDTLTCTVSALVYSCSAATINGGAVSGATLTMTANESGNGSTPSGSVQDATRTLNIRSAVTLTPATFAAAVNGRSYGTGSVCGAGGTTLCETAQFAVSGGLGSYTANPTPSAAPGTWTCVLAGSNYDCSSSSVSATGPFPTSANLSLSASDTANGSTPSGASSTATGSLTVNGPLTLGAPGSLVAAVTGRSYGSGNVCGASGTSACGSAQFPVSGGLGGYTASPTPSAAPGTWTCTLVATNYDCTTSSASATGPFPTAANISLSTDDTANASTPSGTSGTATASLPIDGPITLSAVGSLAAAVNGRSYGTGSNCGVAGTSTCQPAQFAVSGGLGTYPGTATPSAAPGTWSCSLAGSNYNCSSLAVSALGSSFPETDNLSLIASDIANGSTPSGSSSSATNTVSVVAALTLTAPGGLAPAVNGRSFGTGSSCGVSGTSTCQSAQFAVAGGLGGYTASPTPTAAPGTWICPLVGSNYDCSSSSVSAAGPFPEIANLSLSTSDIGNASTPIGNAGPVTSSVTVEGALTLGVNPDPSLNPAVQGRAYGTGSGCSSGTCQAPTFTPAGGLTGAYGFALTGSAPSGINCAPNGGNTAEVCSGTVGSAATSSSFAVTVVDTANISTPAATTATDPQSKLSETLTVDTQLTVSGPALLPYGLQGYPYPNPADSATVSTLTASNGLGGSYTWIAPGSTGCTVGTGSLPTGITLNAVSGELSGTPTAVSSNPGTDFVFQGCVSDPPNLTTPSGIANTSNLTLNVLAPYVVMTEETDNAVEFFNTFTRADSTVTQPVSTGSSPSATLPYGVAFSPSGRYAYVTLSGTNQLAIFDTITNSQVTGSPISLTGCTTPHGVAATANLILIACNGTGSTVDTVAVVGVTNTGNTSTFSLGTAVSPTGAPTGDEPEGVAISPDGSLGYVTLSNSDQLFVLSITGSSASAATLPGSNTNPFTLLAPAAGTVPMGIAVTLVKGTGTDTVAYIAKQGTGGDDGVEILTLTGTNAFTDASAQTLSGNSTAAPTYVAVTPDNTRAYVSLSGSTANAFAVFDNTIAAPNLVTTPPTALKTSSASPQGVAIPVLPLTPTPTYAVFISENGTGKLAVIDNTATPAEETASPYGLSGSAPLGIASTPWPQ